MDGSACFGYVMPRGRRRAVIPRTLASEHIPGNIQAIHPVPTSQSPPGCAWLRRGVPIALDGGSSMTTTDRRKRVFRIARALISLVIVVAIFALILPKIASYSTVWKTLTGLKPMQVLAVSDEIGRAHV